MMGAAGAPISLAPAVPPRKVAAAEFLGVAEVAARRCGVTRVGDVTGLDRIGFPVWQAVRPAGRALSVHQGKGATPLDARIGALCEAIESQAAEEVPADGPVCAYRALASGSRAPEPGDYLKDREAGGPIPERIAWCMARDLIGGADIFLPHDLVSLDFTRDVTGNPFDRSSSGLAVGTCEEEALFTALLELIERDAVGEWERAGPLARMMTTVRPDSLDFAWLDHWRACFVRHDISIAVHAPPALCGVPVLVVTLRGPAEFGGPPRFAIGSGAHPDPRVALFRALAEAIQSRLTLIAGARDDILPGAYRPEAGLGAPVPPVPPGFACLDWDRIAPGPDRLPVLLETLAAHGYRQVAAKRLGADLAGLHVVKMFVPGLGGPHRTRRRPR